MKKPASKKKEEEKAVGLVRVTELFRQAEVASKTNMKRANQYIALARRICTRVNLRMPISLKRRYCKKCLTYLKLGVNARIRLNNGKKTYVCLSCGSVVRVPYKK